MKFRIVSDDYNGYEVQWKRWYWPFWSQPRTNSFSSLEQAELWVREIAKGRTVFKEFTSQGILKKDENN